MAVSKTDKAQLSKLNETGKRKEADRRKEAKPVVKEKRDVNRRRQIDPTTCERDYSDDEVEFMQALDAYKRKHGRMFPTCSEILEVLRGLGYQKLPLVPQPVAGEANPNLEPTSNGTLA